MPSSPTENRLPSLGSHSTSVCSHALPFTQQRPVSETARVMMEENRDQVLAPFSFFMKYRPVRTPKELLSVEQGSCLLIIENVIS